MISVLTMTYKRHGYLEEAVESFLRQEGDYEMIVLNDCPDVQYVFENPRLKIFNCSVRFPNISEKLKYGFSLCSGDYIYRLDDDDLLAPNALKTCERYIQEAPDADIWRSNNAYFFLYNQFQYLSDNINNGNMYSKKYIQRVEFSQNSIIEDVEITYKQGGNIYQGDGKTMIYRWGNDTFHISTFLDSAGDSQNLFNKIDELADNEQGVITLNPHFNVDYWGQIEGV